MSDHNPYEPPKADLERHIEVAADHLAEPPRRHGAAQGWNWIANGFRMFGANPLNWVLICVITLIFMMILSFIPIVSLISYPLGIVFNAGIMFGAHEQHRGGRLEVEHLFSGFKRNTGNLFALGFLYLVGAILVLIVGALMFFSSGGLDFLQMSMTGQQPDPEQLQQMFSGTFWIMLLVMFVLFIPLIMAIWFAPALVILNDVGPIEAMQLSFRACLRNIWPYLIYGLVWIPILIIAVIPLGLGLLVVYPAMMASIYVAYRDILIEDNPDGMAA
ncbi:MAG: hypothetical protein KDG50_05050 [Chromatiales bacterium]|nr:hypothetical protein [Chromatiales bacterium]